MEPIVGEIPSISLETLEKHGEESHPKKVINEDDDEKINQKKKVEIEACQNPEEQDEVRFEYI